MDNEGTKLLVNARALKSERVSEGAVENNFKKRFKEP